MHHVFFIIAKISIRKPGSSSVLTSRYYDSTDEDPAYIRIESVAIIKIYMVYLQSINYIRCFAMQTYKELIS